LYKIPANTLFLGKQLVFVPECHSTNTLGLEMAQKPSVTEGTVIITNNQTAGRGQRGNYWESAPGLNLTFSAILKPGFLPAKDQFYLTIITSLAIRDWLSEKVKHPVSIKWPNDILVHEKKICGILIENQLQGTMIVNTVVGIGLNINQTLFQHKAASSLSLITGATEDLEGCLHGLLGYLEARYLQLRQQKPAQLKQQYLSHLYWRNERHTFSRGSALFEGTITGVDENGRLMIFDDRETTSFDVKEIKFIS
jgi:BirA family transcriptional regulator, biotin operon repressor / biotin---[acetyl-CoA-carboxylase] ligase